MGIAAILCAEELKLPFESTVVATAPRLDGFAYFTGKQLAELGTGKYLILHKQVPMDFFERGKYRMFCLGKSKIRPPVIMNFGTFGVGSEFFVVDVD